MSVLDMEGGPKFIEGTNWFLDDDFSGGAVSSRWIIAFL